MAALTVELRREGPFLSTCEPFLNSEPFLRASSSSVCERRHDAGFVVVFVLHRTTRRTAWNLQFLLVKVKRFTISFQSSTRSDYSEFPNSPRICRRDTIRTTTKKVLFVLFVIMHITFNYQFLDHFKVICFFRSQKTNICTQTGNVDCVKLNFARLHKGCTLWLQCDKSVSLEPIRFYS